MNTIKKLFYLSSVIAIFTACNKGGTPADSASCWNCQIEGKYNGVVIDVDTSVCDKNQQGINDFMSPYNAGGEIATCERAPL
jgi:hypothetical protein